MSTTNTTPAAIQSTIAGAIFADALEEARRAAAAAQPGGDGGTCNFDAPAVDYTAAGMSRAEAEAVITSAGLRCFPWKLFRGSAPLLVIGGLAAGQGLMRTRMAEAAARALNDNGIPAGMYYQMD